MAKVGTVQLSLGFFLDKDVLFSNADKKFVDVAKGHMILFSNHDMENFLKVAALLDGSSIDYLFGEKHGSQNSSCRVKINNVKKFIRSLDTKEQDEVAKFYTKVYRSLVNYHHSREQSWGCWCVEKDGKEELSMELETALHILKSNLGMLR